MSKATLCDYCGKAIEGEKEEVHYDLCDKCEDKGCVTVVGKLRTKTITWKEYTTMKWKSAAFYYLAFAAFYAGFIFGGMLSS